MTTKLSDRSKLIPGKAAPPTAPEVPKPKTEMMLVSPDIATRWLEENVKHNRPINEKTVDAYANDMTLGRWVPNGEAIKFDVNEELIDGQHRLWACINSKVSFMTSVAFDLPVTALPTIDTGKRRSAADAMHMAGIDVSNKTNVAAAIRMILGYRSGNTSLVKKFGVSNFDILEFMKSEPGIAAMVSRARSALGKPLQAMTSPVAAVLYLASRNLNVDEFLDKVGSGEGLTKGSPILTLRNKLLSMEVTRDSRERFWFVVVAWNAYVEGRSLQVIRVPQEPPQIEGS